MIGGSDVAADDDLVLGGSQLPPGVTSLFFAGTLNLNGGLGGFFGDGIRCAGGSITRLEIVAVDAVGSSSTTVGIAGLLGATMGTTTYLQLWYRDPPGPCSTHFNVTHALELVWE